MTPTPSPVPHTAPISGLVSFLGTNLSSGVVIAALTTGIITLTIALLNNRRDYPQDYIKLKRETVLSGVRRLTLLNEEIAHMAAPRTVTDARDLNKRLVEIIQEVESIRAELRVTGANSVGRPVGFYALKLDQHITRWYGSPSAADLASQQHELDRALRMQLAMIEDRALAEIRDGGRSPFAVRNGFTYIVSAVVFAIVAVLLLPSDGAWGVNDWIFFIGVLVISASLLAIGTASLFSKRDDGLAFIASGLSVENWPEDPKSPSPEIAKTNRTTLE
ncbi:MAG: hypothetical protein J0I18_09425 [Actinobacteria bacterium]|nr:hypothetical protein [Actinomycetota bacterium]